MKNRRVLPFLLGTLLILSSCAKMPYQQWNSKLTMAENLLSAQKEEAESTALPDLVLFNGVYYASKFNDKPPYPNLKKISTGIENLNKKINDSTLVQLNKSEKFRQNYLDKPLKTVGPEWANFSAVMGALNSRKSENNKLLTVLKNQDQDFDSICKASKIRAIPMIEYEVQLDEKLSEMEERLSISKEKHLLNKKGVMQREDMNESLASINRMHQKIRQIEAEIQQLSNLYSRINSMRADALLFEGPGISQTAEIKLISQKSRKIFGFLDELDSLFENY